MSRGARFEMVEAGPEWVTIRDLCADLAAPGRLTVTNDAERVVKSLADMGLLPLGRRLRYYDSEGRLDEIVIQHVDGRAHFLGFAPIDPAPG